MKKQKDSIAFKNSRSTLANRKFSKEINRSTLLNKVASQKQNWWNAKMEKKQNKVIFTRNYKKNVGKGSWISCHILANISKRP